MEFERTLRELFRCFQLFWHEQVLWWSHHLECLCIFFLLADFRDFFDHHWHHLCELFLLKKEVLCDLAPNYLEELCEFGRDFTFFVHHWNFDFHDWVSLWRSKTRLLPQGFLGYSVLHWLSSNPHDCVCFVQLDFRFDIFDSGPQLLWIENQFQK